MQSALRCIDCYEQGFIFLDLADPTGWQILYVSPQAALQTGMRSLFCVLAISLLSLPNFIVWKGKSCTQPALCEVHNSSSSGRVSACGCCHFRVS